MRAFETKHQHSEFEVRLASAAAATEFPRPTRRQRAFIHDQDRRRPAQERAFYKAVLGVFDAWGRRLERVAAAIIPEPPVFLAESKGARDDLLGEQILKLAPSEEVREELERIAMDNYASIHTETLEGLNATMGLAIDPSDAMSARVMRAGGRRMGLVDLDKKAKKKLFKILEESRLIGEGPAVIARRIREHVPAGPWRTPKIRSRVIARTETLHAQRVSQLEVAAKARVRKVMIFDDRLGYGDEICAGLNGSVVSVGDARALMSAEHPNGTRAFAPHYDPNDQAGPQPDARLEESKAEFNTRAKDQKEYTRARDAHPLLRGFQLPDSNASLRQYIGQEYKPLNAALRGERAMSKKLGKINADLHASAHGLETDLRVFRGELPGVGLDEIAEGSVVSPNAGWSSTSTSLWKSRDFSREGRIWDIRVPAGQKAIITNAHEAEVILPPNTQLRILRVDKSTGATRRLYSERVIAEVVPADEAAKTIDNIVDEATHLARRADEAEEYASKLKDDLDDLIRQRNDARKAMNQLTGQDRADAKRKYLRINTKVQKARKLAESGAAEAAEARKVADAAAELAKQAAKPPISEEAANLIQLADDADARAVATRTDLEDAIRSRDAARRDMNAAMPAEKPDYKREYLRRNREVQKARAVMVEAEEQAAQARRMADEALGEKPAITEYARIEGELAAAMDELSPLESAERLARDKYDQAAAGRDFPLKYPEVREAYSALQGAEAAAEQARRRVRELSQELRDLPPLAGQADAPDWARKLTESLEGIDAGSKRAELLAKDGLDGWKKYDNLRPGTQTYVKAKGGYAELTAAMRDGKALTDAQKSALADMVRDASAQPGYQGYRGIRVRPNQLPRAGDELDILAPTSTSPTQDVGKFFASHRPSDETVGVLYRLDVGDGVQQIRAAHGLDEIVVMPGHRMQITRVTKLDKPVRGVDYAVEAKIVKIPTDAKPKPRPKPDLKPDPPTPPSAGLQTLEDAKKFADDTKIDIQAYGRAEGLTEKQMKAYERLALDATEPNEEIIASLLTKERFVADDAAGFWRQTGDPPPKFKVDLPNRPNANQKHVSSYLDDELTDEFRRVAAKTDTRIHWIDTGDVEGGYGNGQLSLNAAKGDIRVVHHEMTHMVDEWLAGDAGRALVGGGPYKPSRAGTRLSIMREQMDMERKLRELARSVKLNDGAGRVTDGFSKPVWRQYETARYRNYINHRYTESIEYQTVNAEGLTTIRAADSMLARIADDAPLTEADKEIRRRVTYMSQGAVQDFGLSKAQWRDSYLKWRGRKMAEWESESPAIKRFVETLYGKPAGAVDDVVEQQIKVGVARDTAQAASAREAAARATREAAESDAVRAAARAAREIAESEKRALGKAVDRAEKQVAKASKAKASAEKARERAAARAVAADKAKETAARNRQSYREASEAFVAADGAAWDIQHGIDDLVERLAADRKLQKQYADDIARLERETRLDRIGLPEDVNGVATVRPDADSYNFAAYADTLSYDDFTKIDGFQNYHDLPSGVHDYHGHTYYKGFQKSLRDEKRLTPRQQKIDNDLQDSMRSTPDDRLTWRGEHYTSKADPRYEKLAAAEPGDFIDDKQYMSTTTSSHVASGFGHLQAGYSETVIFQIHVRKGSRTIIANPNEREFLLSRGEKLRVLSKPRVKTVKWRAGEHKALHIDLEVLPSHESDEISRKFNQLNATRSDLAAAELRISDNHASTAALENDLVRARAKADAAKKNRDTASARADAADKKYDAAAERSRQAAESAESATEAAVTAEADSVTLAHDAARIRGRVRALEDRAASAARGEFPSGADVAKLQKSVDSANSRAAKAAEKAKKLNLRAEELERVAASPNTDTLKGIKGPVEVRKARREAFQARKAANKARESADEAAELAERAQKEADDLFAAIPKADELKPPDGIISKEPLDYGPGWTRKGPRTGSNPGGLFEDPEGDRWYLKFMDNKHREANEIAAADLYRAAGIDVPDVRGLVSEGGETGVGSRIQNVQKQTGAQLRNLDGARDGFVVDAWLGNWDVVGMSYDNMLKGPGGKALRLDTGGALLYRAQGGRKGHMFGNTVGELDSLRNASTNRTAASVFSGITDEQLIAGAKKVAMVTDDKIAEIVHLRFGRNTDADALIETLKARRKFILDKYPAAKTAMAEEAADAARIAKEAAESQAAAARKLADAANAADDGAIAAGRVADEADEAAERALRKAIDDTRDAASNARRAADDAEASAIQAFQRAGETEELAKAPVITTKPAKPKKPVAPKPQPTDPRLAESQSDFTALRRSEKARTENAKTHARRADYKDPKRPENAAIQRYTFSEHEEFNEELRNAVSGGPRSVENIKLNMALHKHLGTLPDDLRLFRGETTYAVDNFPVKAGEIVNPAGGGWTSASVDLETARRFQYGSVGRIWDIRAPKGTKSIVTNADEAEVILPPSTRIRVVRVDKWDDSVPGPKLYQERVIAEVVPADTAKIIDDAARTAKPLADQAKIAKQAENHVDRLQANLDEAIRLRDEARAAKQGALDPAAAQREYLRKNRDVQKARKLLEASRGEASDARRAKSAADEITAKTKPAIDADASVADARAALKDAETRYNASAGKIRDAEWSLREAEKSDASTLVVLRLRESVRKRKAIRERLRSELDEFRRIASGTPDPRLSESADVFDSLLKNKGAKRVAGDSHESIKGYVKISDNKRLQDYVNLDYRELNAAYETAGKPITAKAKRWAKELHSLETTLDRPARLFRGEILDDAAALIPGELVSVRPGWASTSRSAQVAAEFANKSGTFGKTRRVWDIQATPGTKAIITNPLESELILPPNTRVRVVKVVKGRRGDLYDERVIAEIVPEDTAAKLADDVVHSIDEAAYLAQKVDEADRYLKKALNELDGAIASRDEARKLMNAAPAADKPALKKEYLRKNRDVQKARKLSEAAQAEATDLRVQANALGQRDAASARVAAIEPSDAWTDVNRKLDDANARLAGAESAEKLAREEYERLAAGREFPLKYPEVRGPYNALQNAEAATERARRQVQELVQHRRTMEPLTDQADAPDWARSPAINGDGAAKSARSMAEEGKDGWVLPDDVRPGTASVYVSSKRTVDYGPLGAAMREGRQLTADQAAAIRDMAADAAPRPAFQGYRGVRLKPDEIPKAGDELDIVAPTSTSRAREVGVNYASYEHAENIGLSGTVGVLYRLDVGDGVRQIRLAHVIDETIVMPGHRMQIARVTKLDVPTADGIEYAIDARIVKIADASKVEVAVDAANDAARTAKIADDAAKLPAKVQEAEKYSDTLQASLDDAIRARDDARAAMNAAPADKKPDLKKEYLRKNRDVQKARKLLEAGRGEASDARKAKAVDDMAASTKPTSVQRTSIDTLRAEVETLDAAYTELAGKYTAAPFGSDLRKRLKSELQETRKRLNEARKRLDDAAVVPDKTPDWVNDLNGPDHALQMNGANEAFDKAEAGVDGWKFLDDVEPGTYRYIQDKDFIFDFTDRLRSGRTLSREQRDAMRDLAADASTRKGFTGYRGMRLSNDDIPKVGDSLDINAPASVSMTDSWAASFAGDSSVELLPAAAASKAKSKIGVIYRIAVPDGVKQVRVAHGIDEVIVMPGRKLRVTGVHRLSDDAAKNMDGIRYAIDAEVVPADTAAKLADDAAGAPSGAVYGVDESTYLLQRADEADRYLKKMVDDLDKAIAARDEARAAMNAAPAADKPDLKREYLRRNREVQKARKLSESAQADAIDRRVQANASVTSSPPPDPRLADDQATTVSRSLDYDLHKKTQADHAGVAGFREYDEGAAVWEYTDGGYHDLNPALRKGGDLPDDLRKMNADMQHALVRTDGEMRVFRGDAIRAGESIEPGGIVTPDAGWLSTSRSAFTARGFADKHVGTPLGGRAWDIRVPKGQKAIITNATEAEVILPPNTQLRILRVDKWDDGVDIPGKPYGVGDYKERVIAEVVPADTAARAKVADIPPATPGSADAVKLERLADEAGAHADKLQADLDESIRRMDEALETWKAKKTPQTFAEYTRHFEETSRLRKLVESASDEVADTQKRAVSATSKSAASPASTPVQAASVQDVPSPARSDPRLAENRGTLIRKMKSEQDKISAQAAHAKRGTYQSELSNGFIEDYYKSSKGLNNALRDAAMGKGELNDYTKRWNAGLQKSLKPIDRRTRVYRGEGNDAITNQPVSAGEVVQPNGGAWISTSTSANVASEFMWDNGRIWDIQIPKGAKSIVMNASEAEVVLPPNSQLRVLRVDKWDDSLPGPKLYQEKVIAEVVDANTAAKAVDNVVLGADDAAKLPAKVKEAEKHADTLQASLDGAIRARDDARAAMHGAADKAAAKREYLRKNREVQKARKLLEASRGEASTARKAKDAADEIASPSPQLDDRLEETQSEFMARQLSYEAPRVHKDHAQLATYVDHRDNPYLDKWFKQGGTAYQDVNASLRSGDALTDDAKKVVEALQKHTKPSQSEMRIFRGEGLDVRTEVGQVVDTTGWTSTSRSAKFASETYGRGRRLWDIRAPDGTNAVISGVDQAEVVLPPNTRLRVLKIEKWDDAALKELPGEFDVGDFYLSQYQERVIAEIVPADTAAKLADDVALGSDEAAKAAAAAQDAEKHAKKMLDNAAEAAEAGSADVAKAKRIADAAEETASDSRVQASAALPDTAKPAVANDARLDETRERFADILQDGADKKRRVDAHASIDGYVDAKQTKGVRWYIGEDGAALELNKALRAGRETTAFRKEIHAAMLDEVGSTGGEMRLFRGEYNVGDVAVGEGDIVSSSAWTSTSTSAKWAQGFAGADGRVWDIRAPKGTRAIITNPDEAEVVLPPNARVRVLRVDKWDDSLGGKKLYNERVIAEIVDADTAKAAAAEEAAPVPITAGSADAKKLESAADGAEKYSDKLQADLDKAIAARDEARAAMNAAPAADKPDLKREYLRRNREVQKRRKLVEAATDEVVDAQKHVIAPIAAREVDETSKTARAAGAREMDARSARNAAEVDSGDGTVVDDIVQRHDLNRAYIEGIGVQKHYAFGVNAALTEQNALDAIRDAFGVKNIDEVTQAIQDVTSMEKTAIYMAVQDAKLAKIVKEGKFKSSAETGKGAFKTIGGDRFPKEKQVFGLQDDAWNNPSELPKYGFIAGREEMDWERIVGWGYGDNYVRFKPSVRRRATMTAGDSYDGNSSGKRSPAVPVNKPDARAMHGTLEVRSEGDIGYEFKSRGLIHPESREKLLQDGATYKDLLDASQSRHTYMEAQMYGDITMDDVDAVVVQSKKAAKRFRRELDKAGYKDVKIEISQYDSRLKAISTGSLDIGATLGPDDIDRLGNDYIDKLIKIKGGALAQKHPSGYGGWLDSQFPEDIRKYRGKYTSADDMADRASTQEKRAFLRDLYSAILKRENGGLPKAIWGDHKPSKIGWTADVANEKLLAKGGFEESDGLSAAIKKSAHVLAAAAILLAGGTMRAA